MQARMSMAAAKKRKDVEEAKKQDSVEKKKQLAASENKIADKYEVEEEEHISTPEELEAEFGVYNKYTDVAAWHPMFTPYIKFCNLNEKIAENDHFNNFVMVCIIIAGALVGIQTYPGMDDNAMVNLADVIILVVFCMECVFKIFAEGIAIWRFWAGKEWKWNNFDFFIVLACLPPPFSVIDLGKQVVVLRLLRLMRLAKVFRKIPQLQMIVMGLVGGMKSISYIVLLLSLIFYLFAISGMMIFKKNDPFHWHSLPIAMMTLFRISTLEDWTDIMYMSIFGCDEYNSGGGLTYCNPATEDCSMLTDWQIDDDGNKHWTLDCSVENCTDADLTFGLPGIEDGQAIRHVFHNTDSEGELIMYGSTALCLHPKSNAFLATLYFIIFVVVSAMVMLSLFVGAVTMAMAESMETMKEEADEKDRLRRKEKGLKAAEDLQKASTRGLSFVGNLDRVSGRVSPTSDSEGGGEGGMTGKAAREKARLKSLLLAAWDGTDVELGDDSDNFTGWKKHYVKIAGFLEWLTEHPQFVNFVTFVILLAGIQVGLNTYESVAKDYKVSLDVADFIISTIFTMEVSFKILACEFEPWLYFESGWNKFDFVIVVGGYLPLDFDLNMLRLLRLLRVLKLVNKLPQLQVIVVALMMGVSSIGYIGVILFIFFYFFSIIGMIFFEKNDPWHFGTLHMTMLTLFRCSTLEDWTDVMYINMFGCEIFGYSSTMNAALEDIDMGGCGSAKALSNGGSAPDSVIYDGAPLAGVYFLIFIMIGALVLLTLFVGVVTTSMEEATSDMKEAQEIEEEVQKVANEEGLDQKQVEMYRTVFSILDLDGGGSIEEDELKVGLTAIDRCPGDSELQSMLLEVDESGDGEVDFAEFLQFMMVVKRKQQPGAEESEDFDGDGDCGVIKEEISDDAINAALAKSAGWKTGDSKRKLSKG